MAVLSVAPARAQTAATNIYAFPVGVSSVTVTWAGDTMTVYQVVSSTDFPLASTTTAQTAYSETIVGYSTNTLASFMVEASSAGFVHDSSTSSVYTQAAQPNGTALISLNGTSETLSWNDSGNPLPTYYNIEWYVAGSTPIVFSTASVSVGSVTATIDNLPGGQTVNFLVQAVNVSGLGSGFDITVSTSLPPINNQAVISSGSYALGISSIAWSWTASTGAINYQLFEDSGVAASTILGPNQLGVAQTGLTPNTTYTDYVQSFGLASSTNSAPFTVNTLAAPTTALTLLNVSSATASAILSWGAHGNPPGTTYNVEWWTHLTSTITVSTQTTNAVLTNLSGGATLYFTVQAQNAVGIRSDFDSTLYGVVPSTSFATSIVTVPAGGQGALTFVLPSSVIGVTFASGTFSSSVNILVSSAIETQITPPPGMPADAVSIQGSGGQPILFKITAVDTNGAVVYPTASLTVSASYLPSLIGSVDPASLTIDYDDPTHGWTPLASSRGPNNTLVVVAQTLGYYQVFGAAPPAGISGITVGPNPLRPIVNPGQLMTFRNLPPGTRVRIFTYIGEKIADIAADGSGNAGWDGRNAAGSYVASGVYLAVIQGAGVKKIMRVAVER
ncbi:MAG: fibronectin type III domain-containing protein [Elusimicrobia bacterium]|nr:fibronectin type III domain-containing protein [Elusimicrobiota bacterium]